MQNQPVIDNNLVASGNILPGAQMDPNMMINLPQGMEQPIVGATEVSSSIGDISVWGTFIHADFITQLVLIILLGCSIWSWTIIINKMLKVRFIFMALNHFENVFRAGGTFDSIYEKVNSVNRHPFAVVFSAAVREWDRAHLKNFYDKSLVKRIENVMKLAADREMDQLEKGVNILASIGSIAPFIGLFAMVWSLMGLFKVIATVKNPTFEFMAPGIIEALFATAFGLGVAIPANAAFNKISNDLTRYYLRLEAFMLEFLTIIERQLDEKSAA